MTPLDIQPYDLDDDLVGATRADGIPRVRVSRPDSPMVVLGRGSDPEVELDVDACARLGLDVRRRRGGGCAVVLDPGNVIVSVALPIPGLTRIRSTFEALTAMLIEALTTAGIEGVESDGVSDLVLDDRKISGSCVHRALGLFYHSATLLVDPDLELVASALRHPPREPAYRRGRAHTDFMGRIAGHAATIDRAVGDPGRVSGSVGSTGGTGSAGSTRSTGGTGALAVASRITEALETTFAVARLRSLSS